MLADKNRWFASVEWQAIKYSSSWKPDTAASSVVVTQSSNLQSQAINLL